MVRRGTRKGTLVGLSAIRYHADLQSCICLLFFALPSGGGIQPDDAHFGNNSIPPITFSWTLTMGFYVIEPASAACSGLSSPNIFNFILSMHVYPPLATLYCALIISAVSSFSVYSCPTSRNIIVSSPGDPLQASHHTIYFLAPHLPPVPLPIF